MMQVLITPDHIRKAMRLEQVVFAAAQAKMAPHPRGGPPENGGFPPREAGVLVLIYPEHDGLTIVLTRRTERLRGHSGQISFPGGRRDPEDQTFTMTALRETCEELGICAGIEIVGTLSRFYIPPSHYNVYPSVGLLDHKPRFNPNPDEVAEVFGLPLQSLLDPSIKAVEEHVFNERKVQVPFYRVNGHKVWGATAIMLSELEARLQTVV